VVSTIVPTFSILGGLPRSGITLLSALLNQHPEIYVTTTSPFVEILWRNYTVWTDELSKDDCNTAKIQSNKIPFLRSLTSAYFKGLTDKPIIIDKRRQWQNPENIKMYQDIFGSLPKVIAPVRDTEDIIKSYLTLFQNNNKELDLEGGSFQTSYNDFKAYYKLKVNDILLVEYDDLIDKTQKILDEVYVYLGATPYENDFTCIEAFEDESYHGINGLHSIRKTISVGEESMILSDAMIKKYQNYNIWKQHNSVRIHPLSSMGVK